MIAFAPLDFAARSQMGRDLHARVAKLFPLCRSLTGPGVRQTLALLQATLPLEMHEVPTGTRVFDWTVPREWHIRAAYLADASSRRIVDFDRCNLHVMSYSVPVRGKWSLAELRPHLHSLPQRPQAVPYRTSYHQEQWGLCLSHEVLSSLGEGTYEVVIDSELRDGSLTYGELFLPGDSREEVLFSCHVCHPSLANDNCAGMSVASRLAELIAAAPARRLSYRFLFVPATLGALCWLAKNREELHHVRHGLVLTLLGDAGHSTYKRSRRGNAAIDQAVEQVLRESGQPFGVRDFDPGGYDERQYCSPGFNLPMGCLMRTPHGEFPEYHTSDDNLDFVKPEALADSLAKLLTVVNWLEQGDYSAQETWAMPDAVAIPRPTGNTAIAPENRYFNTNPHGEPQLGRRGLYRQMGGSVDRSGVEKALLWVLNLSDGLHALTDISQRSTLPIASIVRGAEMLREAGLLVEYRDAAS